MITNEYLALRAARMLVGKYIDKGRGGYTYDDNGTDYSLSWVEIYEILTKMIEKKEGAK